MWVEKHFFFFFTLRLAMCFSPTHIIVLSHLILYFKINLKFNLMELGNKMIKLKQHIRWKKRVISLWLMTHRLLAYMRWLENRIRFFSIKNIFQFIFTLKHLINIIIMSLNQSFKNTKSNMKKKLSTVIYFLAKWRSINT